MHLDWFTWSNPVSCWWFALTSIAIFNMIIWGWTAYRLQQIDSYKNIFNVYAIYLSAGYVFVCAFRSIVPRADVQRICLFDTWFSSVMLGRSLATIGELCFAAQWALVLNQVSKIAGDRRAEKISLMIFPLIFIAECFSWYAVIHTNYIGNTVEESTWALTYSLVAVILVMLAPRFKGLAKVATSLLAIGCVLYVAFMLNVDVPMYFNRWRADVASAKTFLSFSQGIADLNSRWVVTYDIERWKEEIPWMSLYFSVAVWTSLLLCYIPLKRDALQRFLKSS